MKKEYPKLFSSYQQPESESYGDMQPDQSIDCFISELETKVKELNDRMAELEAEKDKIEIKLLDAYDRLSKLGDVEQWAKAVEAENKRLREALIDAKEDAAALIEQHRWIPVTERLPERGQNVLVRTKNGHISLGERPTELDLEALREIYEEIPDMEWLFDDSVPVFDSASWDGPSRNITHWQSIQPPKEQ